jgi:hypothetical protein
MNENSTQIKLDYGFPQVARNSDNSCSKGEKKLPKSCPFSTKSCYFLIKCSKVATLIALPSAAILTFEQF